VKGFPRKTRFSIETNWHAAADAIFTELIVSRHVRLVRSEQWHVTPGLVAALPGTVSFHHAHCPGYDDWILEFPSHGFALMEHAGESVRVRAAAGDEEQARSILSLVRAALPETPPPPKSARVTFWMHGNRGPTPMPKDLAAPSWDEIKVNYPHATSRILKPLFSDCWKPQGGRLLLWHGAPGTGKSFCVRALMSAWAEWCSFHVILDPERFFGGNTEYMVNVLLEGNGEAIPQGSWRMLILEDTGELLSMDARDRSGQGLSRLLNLCDGLLGQSLNVLVLITTNEEIGKLHPAVVRPGRGLANVEFQKFDPVEARQWLTTHGARGPEHQGAMSLADLYAHLEGRGQVHAPQQAVGFLAA